MSRRMVTAIAIVITVAWAVSFMVDIVRPSYDPPESVHTLMLMVAGAAFAGVAFQKNGNGGRK